MIITFIINTLVTFVNGFFGLLPPVELPDGVQSFLSNGVAYYKMFSDMFPPTDLFMSLMLWYFTFKIGMLIAKFFFGSRLPTLN